MSITKTKTELELYAVELLCKSCKRTIYLTKEEEDFSFGATTQDCDSCQSTHGSVYLYLNLKKCPYCGKNISDSSRIELESW